MRTGRVEAVWFDRHGSQVVGDAPSGTQTITVAFTGDFSEDGGQLEHVQTGDVYDYSTADANAETVTLTAPLPGGKSFTDGDMLLVHPASDDMYAHVRLEDAGEDDEALEVRVSHPIRAMLPEGIREPGLGETVRVEATSPGVWVLQDVVGSDPVIDGGYLDPTTVPVPHDGLPPEFSPTPTVQGSLGSLVVKWDGVTNNDPVTYEVHISTTSGFTPDGSTLAAEIAGTLAYIRKMPDGSDLEYGTTYYVKTVAKDLDGTADPSAQAFGQMVQITTPDIAASSIIGDQIVGGTITAEKLESVLVLANRIISGDPAGSRVEFSGPNGIESFNSAGTRTVHVDPDGNATFVGEFATDTPLKQRIVLNPVAVGRLRLTGETNARASTPDTAALDITGDLDIRVKVSMDDWTPGEYQTFVGKGGITDQYSYIFWMTDGNRLRLTWSPTGSVGASLEATATAATGFVDGSVHWVRVTLDVDNGASGRTARFWTSQDGLSWMQLGSEVVQAGVTSIFNSTTVPEVGSRGSNSGSRLVGSVYYAEIRDGIDGTVVANPNFEVQAPGTAGFTDGAGRTWTVHAPAAIEQDGIPSSMRLYPVDGDDNLYATFAVGVSNLDVPEVSLWAATTREDGGFAAWYAQQDVGELSYYLPGESPVIRTQIQSYEDRTRLRAGTSFFILDDRIPSVNGGPRRAEFVHLDSSGNVVSQSALYLRRENGGGNGPWLTAPVKNSGILFGTNRIYVTTSVGPSASTGPIEATAFHQSSVREAKKDVTEVSFDALNAINTAPVSTWRYLHEGDDQPKHVGPMAEDLPQQIVHQDEERGGSTIELGSMVGVLWSAVQDLSRQVDELKGVRRATT